ncbi:hypothetical protein GS421_15375 [Rhodococcus hoagii]|nr:hypothetical protein [Prescottella equi]
MTASYESRSSPTVMWTPISTLHRSSNTAVGEYDMQRVADLLDPRMIRGDPVPDQPEGTATFEQVDPCSGASRERVAEA